VNPNKSDGMPENIVLAAEEEVESRPFTHPAHSREDLERLRGMIHQLIDTYDDPIVCDFAPGKKPICKSDPHGRHFRIYYIQPQLLFQWKPITVVGFFGHKRPNAHIQPLIKADKMFEVVFHQHPGLLSLSTVRLPSGDFGNLVLFTDPESKDAWNTSQPHYDTVSKISPPYYESIRLNNGVLPNGLGSPNDLRLMRVRYLDYSTNPPWRAVRNFET